MNSFVRSYRVRFEDCDPAGIVFYPRYVQMLHRVFEDWCAEGLGYSLARLHEELGIGLPVVDLKVSFRRASRLDDQLDWALCVERLGARSVSLAVRVTCAGQERLLLEKTVVAVALGGAALSAMPVPEPLSQAMRPFCRIASQC